MISELYKRDTYLDKNISYLFNQPIIEYDLKSANTSLCKEYNLLSEDKIESIEKKSKQLRNETIGKLQRKDKAFNEGLKSSFIDIRRRFFEKNQIEDKDILSIKKDAIFCLKQVETTEFGKCKFVEKNKYTSYLYINNTELYYMKTTGGLLSNPRIDVKGIDNSLLVKHETYMLEFLSKVFYNAETSPLHSQLNYMRRFIDKYKMRELPCGYYREFNQTSLFHIMGEEETYDDEVFIPYIDRVNHLDIQYNFFYMILPILNLLI